MRGFVHNPPCQRAKRSPMAARLGSWIYVEAIVALYDPAWVPTTPPPAGRLLNQHTTNKCMSYTPLQPTFSSCKNPAGSHCCFPQWRMCSMSHRFPLGRTHRSSRFRVTFSQPQVCTHPTGGFQLFTQDSRDALAPLGLHTLSD